MFTMSFFHRIYVSNFCHNYVGLRKGHKKILSTRYFRSHTQLKQLFHLAGRYVNADSLRSKQGCLTCSRTLCSFSGCHFLFLYYRFEYRTEASIGKLTQKTCHIVEPVLKDHPAGHKNMASQDRWSLVTGSITLKCGILGQGYVVLRDRWSLMAVVSQDRFYCI